ncbi:MAG: MnhB domain-containing protein [Desulfohalobiaceae bacterium]
MKELSGSPIIQLASRGLAPVIQIFGLYVFFHGHYSPGGGFQGGVLLASSVLLLRLGWGTEQSQLTFPTRLAVPLSAIGALIFAGTGVVALLFGGNFMDYAAIPFLGLEAADVRSFGILFIELGVTIAVMTALVSIYDDLVGC